MTLREKQSAFCLTFCRFVVEASALGYAFTWGEAYRTPEQAARNVAAGTGIARSLHCERLAVDANAFLHGKWLRGGRTMSPEEAEAWERLGRLWESMSPLARWGGRFKSADFNHFSFAEGTRA